jgi:transposase
MIAIVAIAKVRFISTPLHFTSSAAQRCAPASQHVVLVSYNLGMRSLHDPRQGGCRRQGRPDDRPGEEDCVVVNPSSMPKRSGGRIKTDRRDGDALARLHRAGAITAFYTPTPDDEALRDLVRVREDAVGLSTQAKHRLKAFLLRQGELSGTRLVPSEYSSGPSVRRGGITKLVARRCRAPADSLPIVVGNSAYNARNQRQ